MSYRKYELPKQPRPPLDGPTTVFGAIGIVSVVLLVVMLLWCAAS